MAEITVTDELGQEADGIVRPLGSAEQLATSRGSRRSWPRRSAGDLFESTLDGIRRSRPYRIGQAVLNPARVSVYGPPRAAEGAR